MRTVELTVTGTVNDAYGLPKATVRLGGPTPVMSQYAHIDVSGLDSYPRGWVVRSYLGLDEFATLGGLHVFSTDWTLKANLWVADFATDFVGGASVDVPELTMLIHGDAITPFNPATDQARIVFKGTSTL
jgi:hypothetical protein